MADLRCRHCGLEWPGDGALTIEEIRGDRIRPVLSVCIKAPPARRWLIDCGLSGHVFDEGRR